MSRIADDLPDNTEPDEVLSILKAELKRLKSKPIEKQTEFIIRRSSLVSAYIELADYNDSKCDLLMISNRLLLIKFHEDAVNSAMLRYMRHFALKQVDVCLLEWDTKFSTAIEGLGARLTKKAQDLLDHMIVISAKAASNGAEKKPFYEVQELNKLAADPPPEALLCILLEEKAKSGERLERRIDFEGAYNENLRSDLCKPINEKLNLVTLPYKYAFDKDLVRFRREEAENKFLSTSAYLIEWLTIRMVCSAILEDQRLLEKTYELYSQTANYFNGLLNVKVSGCSSC